MNSLLQDLYDIRNLLQTMERLSNEEREVRRRGRAVIPLKKPIQKPKNSKAGTVVILILITVCVFMISIRLCAWKVYQEKRTQYAIETTGAALQWAMEHLGVDANYPGYNEPGPQYEEIVVTSILLAMLITATVTAVTAILIPMIRKRRNASIDAQNIKIEEENRQIVVWNQQNQEYNKRLSEELERIHSELRKYSQEYQENADSWFPRDYATYDAIDYFICQVQNHIAFTIQDAVMLYRREVEHREMQNLYKQQTDAMIKQQKITNILQGANMVLNLSTNIIARQNLEVSRDTNAAAHQNVRISNAIYSETKRAADNLSSINRKLG